MARQDPAQDSCRNILARSVTVFLLGLVVTTKLVRAARRRSK
jgi:hypothetical protein